MNTRLFFSTATFVASLVLVCQSSNAQQLQTRRDIVNDLLGQTQMLSQRPAELFPDDNSSGEKKSVALAAVYSLVLPGMGELYVGSYGTGKYFTIAEGALWIGWGGMQWYGNWLQNDAHEFAAQHAQTSPEGKDDQYFIDIGNFKNVYVYNEQILRGRDVFGTYDPMSSYYWQWDTDANREQYRQLRVSSDEVFNNSRFVIAAIGVNHLLSAINAGRLAISHNKSIDEASTIDIHANVIGTFAHPNGIMLTVTKSF
jgi:hypothetical protein